jgi:hypothetical protein
VEARLLELPHPRVLVRPEERDAVDAVREHLPRLRVEHVALRDIQVRRLEQVAPRSELELRGGRVAVADGTGIAIAAKVVERLPAGGRTAAEVIERPEVGRGLPDSAEEPCERLLYLLGQAEANEGVEREGGVAHPRVAVVVVLIAADRLRERRRRRGRDAAVRGVDEELER